MTDPIIARLDRARELAEKATEGPWGHSFPQGRGKDPIFGATPGDEVATVKRPADWRFIAAARSDVPMLVDALTAVLKAVEDHPTPSRRDDPTDEIGSAIESVQRAVERAVQDAMTTD